MYIIKYQEYVNNHINIKTICLIMFMLYNGCDNHKANQFYVCKIQMNKKNKHY